MAKIEVSLEKASTRNPKEGRAITGIMILIYAANTNRGTSFRSLMPLAGNFKFRS